MHPPWAVRFPHPPSLLVAMAPTWPPGVTLRIAEEAPQAPTRSARSGRRDVLGVYQARTFKMTHHETAAPSAAHSDALASLTGPRQRTAERSAAAGAGKAEVDATPTSATGSGRRPRPHPHQHQHQHPHPHLRQHPHPHPHQCHPQPTWSPGVTPTTPASRSRRRCAQLRTLRMTTRRRCAKARTLRMTTPTTAVTTRALDGRRGGSVRRRSWRPTDHGVRPPGPRRPGSALSSRTRTTPASATRSLPASRTHARRSGTAARRSAASDRRQLYI